MKKTFLKILALALSVMICLSLCTVAFAAGETITDVSLNLQTDSLTVSSEKQTVTATMDLTISGGETIAARGVSYKMSLPTGWTLESYSFPAAAAFQSATTTAGLWAIMSGATDISSIGTLVFGIPADTAAGTYTISISEVKVNDADNQVLFSDGTASATLTIAEASTPTPESPYTVTIADATEGTAKVHAGDEVTMNVTVTGDSFNAYDIYVTYRTDLFTSEEDAQATGVIRIQNMETTNHEAGAVVAALKFTAKDVDATATGDFGFDSTKTTVAQKPIDADQDVVPANVVPDSVTVVKQYTVIFQDKDGVAIENGTFTLDDGASVETVPEAPAVAYYTFAAWNDGTNDRTADEIKALAVTGDVTFKAVYTANSYNVTLGEGLTGDDTATYGTPYTGSITDYDGNSYTYTVTYGEGKNATVNTDGTFTIPGTEITDDLTVSVSKVIQGITVTTHVDFITGYTLIEVKGNAANYSYDGNDMYYVAASGDNYGSYVYLVKGEADQTKVAVSANTKTEIPTGNDVNMTGVVDFSDANAAFCIYNKVDVWSFDNETTVDKLMEKIIRADVNRDYVVNSEDVTAILDAI